MKIQLDEIQFISVINPFRSRSRLPDLVVGAFDTAGWWSAEIFFISRLSVLLGKSLNTNAGLILLMETVFFYLCVYHLLIELHLSRYKAEIRMGQLYQWRNTWAQSFNWWCMKIFYCPWCRRRFKLFILSFSCWIKVLLQDTKDGISEHISAFRKFSSL